MNEKNSFWLSCNSPTCYLYFITKTWNVGWQKAYWLTSIIIVYYECGNTFNKIQKKMKVPLAWIGLLDILLYSLWFIWIYFLVFNLILYYRLMPMLKMQKSMTRLQDQYCYTNLLMSNSLMCNWKGHQVKYNHES